MIPFNRPPLTGNEQQYLLQAIQSNKISGDGYFGKKCQAWFEARFTDSKTLLTPSCTAALEMAAILLDIKPGDEVIMPSYTFVSTANAFVLRGAAVVFVDMRPDTSNIDETKIEAAITSKTKAIVPVHYAGVGCNMDKIMEIAERYSLYVVEDAAQGMMSTYRGRPLGTIGHLGTYSFHETKNYTSGGEGGLLIVNDNQLAKRAEVIREKGTNRSQFFRGQVDKYTWVDIGSSYLPSELQAAYLWGQLEKADLINEKRLAIWNAYHNAFKPLEKDGLVELAFIPEECRHNAHMYYLKLPNLSTRRDFIEYLKSHDIHAVFHYVPLHSAPAGKELGRLVGEDLFTTAISDRLVRLPLHYNLTDSERDEVIECVLSFFRKSN